MRSGQHCLSDTAGDCYLSGLSLLCGTNGLGVVSVPYSTLGIGSNVPCLGSELLQIGSSMRLRSDRRFHRNRDRYLSGFSLLGASDCLESGQHICVESARVNEPCQESELRPI